MIAGEWWELYRNWSLTLQTLAIRILSQTSSASACERNWSTFALVHTKQRNRLAYSRLEKLVFCLYNMKLQLREATRIHDNNLNPLDPLDIIERAFERSGNDNEGDDEMLRWIDEVHMDDVNQNPDPAVAEAAREHGVDPERVLNEDVQPQRGSGDSSDSDGGGSSRRSSGAGGGAGDGGSGGGAGGSYRSGGSFTAGGTSFGDVGGSQLGYAPSQEDFDRLHHPAFFDSGYGRGGQGGGMNDAMSFTSSNDVDDLSYNFGSVSIGPQGTESSYDDGSSSYNYQDSYASSYAPETVQPVPGYPLHSMTVGSSQYEYDYHLNRYFSAYAHYMTWYDYCMTAAYGRFE